MRIVKQIKKNTTRSRFRLAAALTALFIVHSTALAAQTAQTEVDFGITQNKVSGPGAASSSLTRDLSFVGNAKYQYVDETPRSSFSFRLGMRATDDANIDRQKLSLGEFELKWKESSREYVVGDVFAAYSGYSLNSMIKGGSFTYGNASQPSEHWQFVSGIAYPRWESFWGNNDVKAIRRQVTAVGYKNAKHAAWQYGLNVVRNNDSDRINNDDDLYDSTVFNAYWEYSPQEGASIKGESAFSRSTLFPGEGEIGTDRHGSAHQVIFTKNLRHQRLMAEYERVSPNFDSLLASALQDREQAKLKWRKEVDPDLAVNTGIRWARDCLPGSARSYRTTLIQPEITLMFNQPFSRPDATLDLSLRLDRRKGGDRTTNDRSIGLAYQDRLGKYASDLSLEHIIYDTVDSSGRIKNKENTVNWSLATDIGRPGGVLRPSFNIGMWRNQDYIADRADKYYEIAAGLTYNRTADGLRVALKVGKKKNMNDSCDDSYYWFANFEVEGKPKYLAFLGNNATQYFRAVINDYDFETADKNYRETSISTGVRYSL